MKRLFNIFFLVFCFSVFGFAQTATVSTTNQNAKPGDTILVPINVTNFTNVGAITIKLNYDGSVVKWLGAKNINSNLVGALTNGGNGTAGMDWFGLTPINISSGKLVDFQFLYNGGTSALTFLHQPDDIADENGDAISVIYTDGSVKPTPLPVELESFTAKVDFNIITLEWSTATEVNNYGFSLERSIDNANWTKIGFVKGYGNSNSPKYYTFTDNDAVYGNTYKYRLKQIDNDGKYEYSREIEVKIVPKEYRLYQNYPNPFNPTTTVNYSVPTTSLVTIKVYDATGREVETLVNEQKTPGNYNVEFNASKLASGIYFYSMRAGNFISTKKLVLMK